MIVAASFFVRATRMEFNLLAQSLRCRRCESGRCFGSCATEFSFFFSWVRHRHDAADVALPQVELEGKGTGTVFYTSSWDNSASLVIVAKASFRASPVGRPGILFKSAGL